MQSAARTSTFLTRHHTLAVFTAGLLLAVLTGLMPGDDTAASRDAGIDPMISISGIENGGVNFSNHDALENWQTFVVEDGDTLSSLFTKAGLSNVDLNEIVQAQTSSDDLTELAPGQKVAFLKDDNNQLNKVKLKKNELKSVVAERKDGSWKLAEKHRAPLVRYAFKQGVINSSLFAAGQKAGLTDQLTMKLAEIFGWDVDFALDLRDGDSFAVLYEERYLDGKKIDNGRILSAQFINQGRQYQAVLYTDRQGVGHYYTPVGNSMHKAFLRTPVEFARISSPFSLSRAHPVLHTMRAHKGTDYAAPRGTPVYATGDGTIAFAGQKNGYGNVLVIRHAKTYETLYAHLNNFSKGVLTGTAVRQGQTIGFVGSTGLATGAHLHYEFHIDGAVHNPVTVTLPNSSPIPEKDKPLFLAQTQPLMTQMMANIKTGKISGNQLAMSNRKKPAM